MAKRSPIEQLDEAVQAILANPDRPLPLADEQVGSLARVAAQLRDLPREEFRAYLRNDLRRRIRMAAVSEPVTAVHQTATPRLRVRNAAAAIQFYEKAFGAKELWRFEHDGSIPAAEIMIGNSVLDLADANPEYGYPGPDELGGSPISINLQVEDVDAFVQRAVAAGCRIVLPVKDQFYGRREGTIGDPFGYNWSVFTEKEQVSVEEMHRRLNQMTKPQDKASGVSPIPKGYHTVTPYLIAQNAPLLIDFITRAFGGAEVFRSTGSAGGLHAEVRVRDSMLMIGGGSPKHSWRGDAMPTSLHLYVPYAD